MDSLNFSRSVRKDIKTMKDRKLYAILDYSRTDSKPVSFTGEKVLMNIYNRRGGSLINTLTSGVEITVATSRLIVSKTFTDLVVRAYYFEIFKDTEKEGIQHGKLIVI